MLDKDKEVEAAWLIHEPERAAIPADVWRQLRAWKRGLLATAAVIETLLKKEKLAQIIEPAIRKRGVGRQRKLVDLRKKLPGANIRISHKDILEISWLSPKRAILADPQHHGETQDCTLVCFMIAWPPTPRTIQAHSAWALEVSDHAAARMLQRVPTADLRSALFDAGLTFVTADANTMARLIGTQTSIYLPTASGAGAFAATCIGAKTLDGQRHFTYARTHTFLSALMLRPDQVMLPRAASPEETVALALWRWADDGMVVPTFTKGNATGPVRRSGSGVDLGFSSGPTGAPEPTQFCAVTAPRGRADDAR
jgi:hypothetical protein